jgi:hypothetical protein
MADLKMTEERAVAAVRARAESAIADVRREAEEQEAAMRTAASTLRDLAGKSASDLLALATMAAVSDITMTSNYGGDPGPTVQQVVIHTERGSKSVGDGNLNANVRPGRYRALFLLLPLPPPVERVEDPK